MFLTSLNMGNCSTKENTNKPVSTKKRPEQNKFVQNKPMQPRNTKNTRNTRPTKNYRGDPSKVIYRGPVRGGIWNEGWYDHDDSPKRTKSVSKCEKIDEEDDQIHTLRGSSHDHTKDSCADTSCGTNNENHCSSYGASHDYGTSYGASHDYGTSYGGNDYGTSHTSYGASHDYGTSYGGNDYGSYGGNDYGSNDYGDD